MNLTLSLIAALVLGSMHALEADHVSAVTAFATGHPRWREAVSFGLRWAVGHGAAIVVVGTALLLSQQVSVSIANAPLERLVGLVLIGLGAWSIWNARHLHQHVHTHADGTTHVHVHSHALGGGHAHRHGATSVGLLHGAAGAAPAVALIPLASLDSLVSAVGFLIWFAIGTLAGMMLYAMLAGYFAGRVARASVPLAQAVATLAGCATIAVGLLWLLR